MSVDIYHSRRTKFIKCPYWIRDESQSVGNLAQWVLTNKISGYFYAQPVNNFTQQGNNINGVAMFDKTLTTLWTSDDVEDIKRGCVVQYNGHAWMVDSVVSELHIKETEFGHNHYDTYISLRK